MNKEMIFWLIPLLPLIGAAKIAVIPAGMKKRFAGFIASAAIFISFILSVVAFVKLNNTEVINVPLFDWIAAGNLHIPFALQIDHLSGLFLLIITGIGFLIHLYSTGYMHHDENFPRFFIYLNLFVFFMLLLVLGNNYLLMFVGWEGVGLCSYLLIGFWFKNTAYNNAAKKAFIMNRIGDLGFLLGIILIFTHFNSVVYSEVFEQAKYMTSGQPVIVAITLLLFVGAMGKSAQIPLYTWLPDAMAGPTPVSALIHAATMVTAGIYMVARSNILYSLAPLSMEVVAITGLITALFAATIGLAQTDIKKVLAYSTVSQLGYMFLGLGVGAYTGAVFHVATHAFFKALLFLGAGSVIHAMSGEQDIRNMGGLKKYLPVTYLTFLLGTIAISGIPPFSGFFSKDEILAHAYEHNKFFWILGLAGSMLTAFYMFRLLFLTFFGEFRGTKHQMEHLHESPSSMTIPLIVLAILSVIGGFMGIPHAIGEHLGHIPHWLEHFLEPVFADSSVRLIKPKLSATTEYGLMALAVALAILSILYARSKFVSKKQLPVDEADMPVLHKTIYHKYYIDEIYDTLITKPLNLLSEAFSRFVESRLIDSVVNSLGMLVQRASSSLRIVQTGQVGFYIFAIVVSVIMIFVIKFL